MFKKLINGNLIFAMVLVSIQPHSVFAGNAFSAISSLKDSARAVKLPQSDRERLATLAAATAVVVLVYRATAEVRKAPAPAERVQPQQSPRAATPPADDRS